MADLHARLRATFHWRSDPTDDYEFADVTGWWRDPEVLAGLGPALAALAPSSPTVVVGPDSRGALLGSLVARELGVGFVEVRKNRTPAGPAWIRRATPPDYHERGLTLGFRRELVQPSDRVLAVDDWIDTGAQLVAVQQMVDEIGAAWLGLACVVDALRDAGLRHALGVRALLHVDEL